MADALLTIYAGRADAGTLADALRTVARAPVHVRAETVFGLDFSDATTAERVTGALDRVAIDLIVDDADVPAIVASIAPLKRSGPIRWHSTPLAARGRLP